MTLAAVIFVFGMPFDDRPGADELFEQVLRLRGGRDEDRRKQPDCECTDETPTHRQT